MTIKCSRYRRSGIIYAEEQEERLLALQDSILLYFTKVAKCEHVMYFHRDETVLTVLMFDPIKKKRMLKCSLFFQVMIDFSLPLMH